MSQEVTINNKSSAEKTAISILTEKVNSLYIYRDHYFENRTLDSAGQKKDDIEGEMKKTLQLFEDLKENGEQDNRAMYLYLKGRTLNVIPQYCKEAEEILSRSVKLDPKLVGAWNELGECYWKKDDIGEAKNCFSGALSHELNKVSLRNLSMVLRQEKAATPQQHVENISKGVEYAKAAINLDPNDGKSWTILGNAYLSSFFTLSQNPRVLKACKSAYQQAERDIVSRSNPELYYNKAVALKYEEQYESALASYSQAQALDPSWDTPGLREKQLVRYLDAVQELVKHKGKLKSKKLQQLIHAINVKHLGPYGGGNYTSKDATVKLEFLPFSSLQEGTNLGKVVLGKVVCSVRNEDEVPFTFCMIDKEEMCIAVTVYNLAQGKGAIIGDSVAIPEPHFTRIHFKHKEKEWKFDSIRVENPLTLVINGRKVGPDQLAGTQLSTFKRTD